MSITKKVGMIGLGAMGKPMAKNLMKAGFPLTVYNRSRQPVDELSKLGAKPANSPKEVGENSEIVITIVHAANDVEQVVAGDRGLLEGMKKGIICDMSTIDPLTERRLAELAKKKGVAYLDAPVSGGSNGAEKGTLTIMVGGPKEAYEQCMDVFKVMGKNIFHVGDVGAGQTMKLVNQILVAVHVAALSEALIWANKVGVDLKLLYDVIKTSMGNSRIWEDKFPKIVNGDLSPGFKVWLQHKDLRMVLNVASELNIPLPVTSLTYQLFGAARVQGVGDLDHSALVKVLENMSGIKVTPN